MTSPVNPGDILLGKYRIDKVLGQGGMGVVVAAHHVDLGQRYAIKFLLPTGLTQEEAVARFLREARASARLQSEHVARVHDVGNMENGAPYMVMEYLEGSDLKALLTKQGPLPAETAMSYLAQVCDAIGEAHAAGIVHRDLKPANLFLVRRRNGSPCVKVLDFGISKHLGGEEVDLTSTNATLGSPLYMSPEQISKSKTVDARTDIWALGVILYELLTGRSPFRAGTALEVVSRILQEEPVPVRQLRPDVPERAEVIIARCLRKRREERFQSVDEILQFIEKGTLSPNVPPLSSTSPSQEKSSLSGVQGVTGYDPTSVAFGQTQVMAPRQSSNSLRLAIAAGATVVVVGGIFFGIRGMSAKSTSEASSSALAAQEQPSAAAPATSSSIQVVPATGASEVSPAPNTSATAAPAATVKAVATAEKAKATSSPTSAPAAEPTSTTKKKRGLF